MKRKYDIFRRVMWFDKREKFDLENLYPYIEAQRDVSDHPRYISGTFYSEKCGKDIQYESGLEQKFAEKDLENNKKVIYYCDQPIKIPFQMGKHHDETTLDFLSYHDSLEVVITEVKPLFEMLDSEVQAKAEGTMEFCSSRGFGYLLTDGKHTPVDILKGRVNRKLEKELLLALDRGPIKRMQYREIMKRCSATESEFLRAVIRHDLKLRTKFPYFKLTRGNQSPIFRQVYFQKQRYDDLNSYTVPEWLKR